MRSKSWLKAWMFLPALCLAAVPVFAQQQDNSQQQTGDAVADAARKARDDKKTAPKTKKVYTEDDISRKHNDTPSQSASSTNQPSDANAANAPASGDNASGAAPADDKKNDEATWRRRFKEMHTKIADAEKELDILQRETEKALIQYSTDPQKALFEQNSRKEVNENRAKIEAKKQEIDQLKKSLSDMEDELRKAGGDPGWANG
jgi:chromosome segregation ATPase